MPTLEDARRLASNFERVYPETLPRQLAWWVRSLGIKPSRFIQLIQARPGQASNPTPRTWQQLVTVHRQRAVWIEELLGQLLARYSYDWEALAADLNEPPKSRLEGYSPRIIPHRGKSRTIQKYQSLVEASHRSRRDRAPLKSIYRGGPDALNSLLSYLAKK